MSTSSRRFQRQLKVFAFLAPLMVAVYFYNSGMAKSNPVKTASEGARTVADVIEVYGSKSRAKLLKHFSDAETTYPPETLTLLAIKQTGLVEMWANDGTEPQFITSYPIKAQSGSSGPKLREGDHQVPEGLYRIIGLNPNSRFHLSMKLDYPNEFDSRHARTEGRTSPGSNIFIHGKAASVGCLAMGDPVIEELFVLTHDVGRQNINVVIAPTDPRTGPLERIPELPWTDELYTNIETEFGKYLRN